jgi:hypothetical protein
LKKCRQQIEDSPDGLPEELDCTGLYKDFEDKVLEDDVVEFAPAHRLWSDGADKTRWIHLPKGEKIDTSDPDSWVFPVGTKAWKEFAKNGKRVETRLYEKADSGWAKAAYVWNDDETETERGEGADLTVDGEPYHVPTNIECNECHNGRKDRLLGFEQVGLGLPGSTGLTLAELVDTDRLENFSGASEYTISDDGSGVAEPALGWLHMNCGVSCHNGNPGSKGYSRGMRLQLKVAELEAAGNPRELPITTTTVGQDAATLRWNGQKRIVAGSPDESLLYKLISQRGNKDQQMPPIGTVIVPELEVEQVAEWIRQLPAGETETEEDVQLD